jgi:hypothetical protein
MIANAFQGFGSLCGTSAWDTSGAAEPINLSSDSCPIGSGRDRSAGLSMCGLSGFDPQNVMYAGRREGQELSRIAVGHRAPFRRAGPRQRADIGFGKHSFEELVGFRPRNLLGGRDTHAATPSILRWRQQIGPLDLAIDNGARSGRRQRLHRIESAALRMLGSRPSTSAVGSW